MCNKYKKQNKKKTNTTCTAALNVQQGLPLVSKMGVYVSAAIAATTTTTHTNISLY